MRVVILGAGVTGLTCGYELAKGNHEAIILEKESTIGGALASTKKNGYSIENFYHHVFLKDTSFLKLMRELKLINKVEERTATTSFYYKGKYHNLSSPTDIIGFRLLNVVDKMFLAKLLLKIKLVRDYRDYDNTTAKEFILKHSSKKVYRVFFEPLLTSKFGGNKEKISAAWLIKRLKLRGNRGAKGEKLEYPRGGFAIFTEGLENYIKKHGGRVITSCRVETIDRKARIVHTDKGNFSYDKLMSTIPPQVFNKMAGLEGKELNYQGTVCLLLSLKEGVTPSYWTNIMDNLSFGAIVENTNFVPKSRYNDEHLIYLASYYGSDDKIWDEDEGAIIKRYLKDLKKIKRVNKKDINWYKVFRYRYSGLVYKTGTLQNIPPIETADRNIFMAGMLNSYPERSINESIKFGEALSKMASAKRVVCVTIPVYNEEKILESSILKLRSFLQKNFSNSYYIVIADNASKDRTRAIGEKLAKRYKDVKYQYIPVKGRGIALRTVWTKYDADIYSYMDVDLSTELKAFPKIVEMIQGGGFDVTTGDRLSDESKTKRGLKREILSRGYNLILKAAFRPGFKDAQCGFKAVSRKVVREIVPRIKDNNWFFDTELLLKTEHAGYSVGSLPVKWIEDPDSKVKSVETVLDYLASVRRVRKEFRNEKAHRFLTSYPGSLG